MLEENQQKDLWLNTQLDLYLDRSKQAIEALERQRDELRVELSRLMGELGRPDEGQD